MYCRVLPLATAWIDGQGLRLRLRQRASLGAFGATTLYLAVACRHGIVGWRAALPRAAMSIGLVRLVSGMRVMPAVGEWRAGGRDVRLPLGIFADARAVYAKLERRFGFFDAAGWCELPVPRPRRRVPRRPLVRHADVREIRARRRTS